MNHVSTRAAEQPELVNLAVISLRLFSLPLDKVERLGAAQPAEGSRWPLAGPEPSSGATQLQSRETRPDSSFAWFALFKWFLERLLPAFPTPNACNAWLRKVTPIAP